jgi:hypothetical protein
MERRFHLWVGRPSVELLSETHLFTQLIDGVQYITHTECLARRLHIAAVSHERAENGFPDLGGFRGTLHASKSTFLGRSLPVRRPAPWRLALKSK